MRDSQKNNGEVLCSFDCRVGQEDTTPTPRPQSRFDWGSSVPPCPRSYVTGINKDPLKDNKNIQYRYSIIIV